MNGWTAHMKYRVVPASAVTSWEMCVPLLVSPVNQESPFLPVAVPIVLQPAGPAFAGFLVIFSVFGLNPCHWAIAKQIFFGVKQVPIAFRVFGIEPLVTSEKVCGPTCLGLVLLTIS